MKEAEEELIQFVLSTDYVYSTDLSRGVYSRFENGTSKCHGIFISLRVEGDKPRI